MKMAIARYVEPNQLSAWSGGVGRFVAEVADKVEMAAMKRCHPCPFRKNLTIGGCIKEDCPIWVVRKTLSKATTTASTRCAAINKSRN